MKKVETMDLELQTIFYRMHPLAPFYDITNTRGFEYERPIILNGFHDVYERIGRYNGSDIITIEDRVIDLEDDIIQHLGIIPGEMEELIKGFSHFKSDESPKPEYVKYYEKFFHDAQHLYDLVDQQPEDRQEEIYRIINEKSYELWTVLVRCIQSSTSTHDYDTNYNHLVALISNRS